jgi:hypothetical protein
MRSAHLRWSGSVLAPREPSGNDDRRRARADVPVCRAGEVPERVLRARDYALPARVFPVGSGVESVDVLATVGRPPPARSDYVRDPSPDMPPSAPSLV